MLILEGMVNRWPSEAQPCYGSFPFLERPTAEGLSRREILCCLKRYVLRETYRTLDALEGHVDNTGS